MAAKYRPLVFRMGPFRRLPEKIPRRFRPALLQSDGTDPPAGSPSEFQSSGQTMERRRLEVASPAPDCHRQEEQPPVPPEPKRVRSVRGKGRIWPLIW